MNKSEVLSRLDLNRPLFDRFPKAKVRICGIDCELGGPNDEKGNPINLDHLDLPLILNNGGQLIIDCDHVEYGTPECPNVVELIAYQQAMLALAHARAYPLPLHHNNCDWDDHEIHTFGCHVNFCTLRRMRDEWPKLLPLFVALTVMNGSGYQHRGGLYEISQRARRMDGGVGNDTPSRRTYINTRYEPHCAEKSDLDRFHVIYGDSHMIEINSLAVYTIMSLAIELMELKVLPEVEYCQIAAVQDGISISGNLTGPWQLAGITKGPRDVLELLSLYVEKEAELFMGRDDVVDAGIIIAREIIERLGKDPMSLFSWLDWVTKLELINGLEANRNGDCSSLMPENVDLEYHNIDPDPGKSLYSYLRCQGFAKRVVSKGMVKHAKKVPPLKTRANARGAAAKLMRRYYGENWVPSHHRGECWKNLDFVHDNGNHFNFDLADPFHDYAEYVHLMEEDIIGLRIIRKKK